MFSPFHVYLDLDVRNDDVTSSSQPPPLIFDETRLSPFLKGDVSDYFCTIARFTLQTSNSIPVFIPEIESATTVNPGQVVYNTIYKIAFKQIGTGRVIGPLNVVFVPSDYTSSPPPSGSTADPSNRFFYVHSYQQFIDMINNTLISLFGGIVQAGQAHYNPPYMEWNNDSYTATINADSFYFDTSPSNTFLGTAGFTSIVTGKWEIYFNTRLFQLFNTFPATFVSISGDLNYRLDIFGTASNTVKLPLNDSSGNPLYNISMAQEISTISSMSPLDSIVFTSSSLPILPSLSSPPKIITSDSKSTTGGGLPNITNVLTDFQIALSATNHYKPEIAYAPQGEYRLIDMYTNTDLSRIDLQVFWKDKKGTLHQLLLFPGCSASVKFLFRHKHFYLGV